MSTESLEEHREWLLEMCGKDMVDRNPLPEWFDSKDLGPHKHVDAVLNGRIMAVDEKLKDLLERINGDALLTVMSCQYNNLGWASISFSFETYYYFIKTIREQHIRKYGTKDGYVDYDIDSLWIYICKQPKYCLQLSVNEWCGRKEFDPWISWQIPPHELSRVVELYDKLFELPTTE